MPPTAFLPGYLIYILEIFLPGIGFSELLGISKIESGLFGRIALAFGLGLSIDTIVFLVKTSRLAGMTGIDLSTVYFLIVIGAVALVASFAIRRKFSIPLSIKRSDVILLMLMLIQGLILIAYFQKYPIFPQYQSQDFQVHVQYVQGLISGSITSIPTGLLYFGVHYQLASTILLVGGEPLVTIQRTMAILILFSPLLFYLGAKRVFSSERVGLIAAVIYTLSGTIWYAMVLDTGLYPNFYGVLSALFLVIALTIVVEQPRSPTYWAFFLLSVGNAYMSHYTLLTILPAILIVPIVQFATKRKDARNYIAPVVVLILPALIPFIIFPNLAQLILYLASSGGGTVVGSTTLSQMFDSIPVLKYLAIVIYDDIEFIVLLILSAVYLYKSILARNAFFLVPIVWFVALLIAAPIDTSAWRFSDEALIPLILMASYGLYTLFPTSSKKSSMKNRAKSRREQGHLYTYIIILIFFGALLVGSYGQMVVADELSNTALVSQNQNYVYQSIYWLQANTPNNASYLSVSDWRFTYTNLLIGRTTQLSYEAYLPSLAISLARNISAQYIIVTNIVTEAVPSNPNLFAWNNFPSQSNSNLTLVFTNTDVRIYQIRP